MWENAKKIIDETFFHDEIELYRNSIETDSIGEEHEVEVLVGTYKCNLQYDPTSVQFDVSGKAVAQTMRISLAKGVDLTYLHTYKVKIKLARLEFDNTFWKVVSWTESQISTVLNVSREVKV